MANLGLYTIVYDAVVRLHDIYGRIWRVNIETHLNLSRITFVTLALLVVLLQTRVFADDHELNFTSMSLDDLLNTEITRREPMGIHHTHKQGEWMISLNAMHMSMGGNHDGSAEISTAAILIDFMVAPTHMDTDMFMLGAMYAPSDTLTLMAMLPYFDKFMEHVNRRGLKFSTRSQGVGDLSISALKTVWHSDQAKFHIDLGLSVPIGSIDRKDATPLGKVRLPYPMQLGSGTWDVKIGATYQAVIDNFAFGVNVDSVLRTGKNNNDYRLGNSQSVVGFISYLINNSTTAHLRLDGSRWSDISGDDPQLNPLIAPTARADLRGGRRVDLGLGINFFADSGRFDDQRISIEWIAPIARSLHGPQLESKWMLRTSWSWLF